MLDLCNRIKRDLWKPSLGHDLDQSARFKVPLRLRPAPSKWCGPAWFKPSLVRSIFGMIDKLPTDITRRMNA